MSKKVQLPLTNENLDAFCDRYGDNIELFAKEMLCFEKFDDWQTELHRIKMDPNIKKIAIASCHSSGKTLNACIISLHHLLCFSGARVLITSATMGQLKSAFQITLHEMIENSLIKNWFDVTAEQITIKGVDNAWIRLRAWSINSIESFQGIHTTLGGPLHIFDEASGIAKEIFQAVDGNMMHKYSKIILLGNPLYRHGELFDAFNKKQKYFHTIHVSALDSSFVSQEWIDEMKDTYGEDSDVYRIRVLGEFPKSDSDIFINDHLLRSAINREVETNVSDPIIGALDVGRTHDKSILVVRCGKKVTFIKQYATSNTNTLQHLVEEDMIVYNLDALVIDQHGVGAGVFDYLNTQHPDNVYPVNLTNAPATEIKYFNYRAKWWGLAKDWLAVGSIPKNDFTDSFVAEGSSLLYTFDKLGRYQLETKELARKRGVHSPDIFDAFAYTFSVDELYIIQQKNRKLEQQTNNINKPNNYVIQSHLRNLI